MEIQPPVPQLERANVLLVDDHPENLLALEAVLEPLKESLFLASSGVEALRLLLKHEFSVILLDAQMPEMSGFETAALIRAREKTRNVPIIFVTAHGRDKRQLAEGYHVGAVDYIAKPFEPDILRSKVRVFVDLYKKNEQLRRQAQLLHEAEMADAERRQLAVAEALEREHMRKLTQELEARVQERTAELLTANKELESFCYSVSHDLRAPLRAISATSMMLLEGANASLDEDQREKLLRQAAAAKRLGDLIDDLLSLARLSRRQVNIETVNLTAVGESVAAEVVAGSSPSHVITVQTEMSCVGDVALLRILVQNLLENACKYSPEGGAIDFGCEEGVYYVRDSGIGFSMEYAHKIFLPFERLVLDSDFPGTGIGLANSQRIVERHGGRIWVDSAPGKGSTFYFTLNAQTDSPPSGSYGSTKTMHLSESVS